MKFVFPETQRSGDVALVLENASVGWDGKALYAPLESLQIKRGQKMGIVGLNGTGKSTILRIMAGLLEPDQVRASACAVYAAPSLPPQLTLSLVSPGLRVCAWPPAEGPHRRRDGGAPAHRHGLPERCHV